MNKLKWETSHKTLLILYHMNNGYFLAKNSPNLCNIAAPSLRYVTKQSHLLKIDISRLLYSSKLKRVRSSSRPKINFYIREQISLFINSFIFVFVLDRQWWLLLHHRRSFRFLTHWGHYKTPLAMQQCICNWQSRKKNTHFFLKFSRGGGWLTELEFKGVRRKRLRREIWSKPETTLS